MPPDSNDNDNDEGDGKRKVGGGSCTEKFYSQKVKQICHLDVHNEKNKSQMKDIMTRSFYHGAGTRDELNMDEKEGEAASSNGPLLSDDELIELASHVLSMKDIHALRSDGGADNEDETEIQSSDCNSSHRHDESYDENDDDSYDTIPQHLRLKFEQAVQRGELSHLISQWYPYWLPDYDKNETRSSNVSSSSSTCGDNIDTEEDGYVSDEIQHQNKINDKQCNTLDERILSIPKVAKSSSSHPGVQLQFNICELLYQTSFVLRAYNGCNIGNEGAGKYIEAQKAHARNRIKDVDINSMSVKIYSALHLHSRSFVLLEDKRYENINEVLMDCTIIRNNERNGESLYQSTNKQYGGNGVVDSKVLLNDLFTICQNKRIILRVLFDTVDILDAGYRCLKKRTLQTESITVERSNWVSEEGAVEAKKKLKLAKKKVEYYLSWIVLHWDVLCCQLINEIRVWMDDWVLKDVDVLNMNGVSLIRNVTDVRTVEHPKQEIVLPSIFVEQDVKRSVSVSSSEPLLVPVFSKKVV